MYVLLFFIFNLESSFRLGCQAIYD